MLCTAAKAREIEGKLLSPSKGAEIDQSEKIEKTKAAEKGVVEAPS